LAAHLDEAPLLAPVDVGQGAHGDVEEGILPVGHGLEHSLGELLDLGRGLLRDRVRLAGGRSFGHARYSSSGSGRPLALFLASRASISMAFCSSFISAAVTLCATCRNSFLMGPGFRPVI